MTRSILLLLLCGIVWSCPGHVFAHEGHDGQGDHTARDQSTSKPKPAPEVIDSQAQVEIGCGVLHVNVNRGDDAIALRLQLEKPRATGGLFLLPLGHEPIKEDDVPLRSWQSADRTTHVAAEYVLKPVHQGLLVVGVLAIVEDGRSTQDYIRVTVEPNGPRIEKLRPPHTSSDASYHIAVQSRPARLDLQPIGWLTLAAEPARADNKAASMTWSLDPTDLPITLDPVSAADLTHPLLVFVHLNNHAVALLEKGKFAEARIQFEHANQLAQAAGLRLDVRCVLWVNQGLAAYERGQSQRAMIHWRLSEQYPITHVGMAGAMAQFLREHYGIMTFRVNPEMAAATRQAGQALKDGAVARMLDRHGFVVPEHPVAPQQLELSPALINRLPKGTISAAAIAKNGSLVLLAHEVTDARRDKTNSSLITVDPRTFAFQEQLLDTDLSTQCTIGVSDEGVRLVILDRLHRKISIVEPAGHRDVGMFDVAKDALAGQFFDGTDWWVLTANGADAKVQRVATTDARVHDGPAFKLPRESRIHALTFASRTAADVLIEKTIDLRDARNVMAEFVQDHQASISVLGGERSREVMRQMWAIVDTEPASVLAIVRVNRGEIREKVLQLDNNQALGASGRSIDRLIIHGSPTVDTAAILSQTARVGKLALHTLVQIDRHHKIRAATPIDLNHVVDAQLGRPPLVAIGTDQLFVIAPAQSMIWRCDRVMNSRWRASKPMPENLPSADRPIVIHDHHLIFGGPDGVDRKKMTDKKDVMDMAVSGRGKYAAVLRASKEVGTVLELYNPEGEMIGSRQITNDAYYGTVQVDDQGFLILHLKASLADRLRQMFTHRGPIDPATVPENLRLGIGHIEGKWWPIRTERLIHATTLMGDQSWIAMVGSSQDGYELRLYRQDQQIWGTALKFKEDDLKTLPVMTVNPYVDRPVIHIMTPETVLRFNLKGEPIHDQGNQ